MKPCKTKKMKAALEKKGFVGREGDHTFFVLHVDGKKTGIRTKISHGCSEYGAPLLGLVAKELALTNKELGSFLDCPLTEEEYVNLLKLRGMIRL